MQKDGELPEGSYLVLPINMLSHKLGNSHRNFSFTFHTRNLEKEVEREEEDGRKKLEATSIQEEGILMGLKEYEFGVR